MLTALDEPTKSTLPSYRLAFRPAAHLRTMRWLVFIASLCLAYLLWGFYTVAQPGYAPLYWLLLLSLGYKVLWMLHEWVHYTQVRVPVPPTYTPRRYTVDMLTTACPGEPHSMIITTLEAMQAVRYPHTSYLCDEGDDPVLRAACVRLGVVHVTREQKTDAKAGNINNALRQATGELCVVMDPDHVPTPDFLDKVVAYFEDERVGFVQVVQAYGNQHESLVARGAAEQTYHFYGPLMTGMNTYGTVQAIGANCTFRRVALDSIGGHAAGLTEDMHTAMRLHAVGWQSVYVPEIVSRGLVPASLAAFYAQQLKWSRGSFDLLFRVYPKLFKRFTWKQRLHYFFLPLYFFSGVITLIDLSLPFVSLGISQFPLLVQLSDLAQYTFPLLVVSLLIRSQAQRWLPGPGEGGMHLAGSFLHTSTWWVYSLGFTYAVLGVRVPYLPTPKEGRSSNEWQLTIPNLLLIALMLLACAYGYHVDRSRYTKLMIGMTLVNVMILVAAVVMGQHKTLRSLTYSVASWPFRWVARQFAYILTGFKVLVLPLLRQFSVGIGLAVLVFGALAYNRRAAHYAHSPSEWMQTGAHSLHLGKTLITLPEPALSSATATVMRNASPDSSFSIVAVPLSPFSPQLPLLVQQAPRHVPLLSWSVSATDTWKPDYWKAAARQVANLPGPVLLRPHIKAATASDYRRAWRHMFMAFLAEHTVNAVWVWTPEASDTLLERFPGVFYTTWIATPLEAADGAPAYTALRPRLAVSMQMHQLPVMVLAAPDSGDIQHTRRYFEQAYPEVKALVLRPSTHPAKAQTAGQLPTSHPLALQPR
jgi:cellulose synthase (UDP-forming)